MAHPTYRDLKVWQKAMELVTAIYTDTQAFPKSETYGLTSQMRRAAVSIPSNIAEGQGRRPEATSSLSCATLADRFLNWKRRS